MIVWRSMARRNFNNNPPHVVNSWHVKRAAAYPSFTTGCTRGVTIVQVVLAVIIIIASITHIVLTSGWGTGIWTGIFYLVTGIVGCTAVNLATKCRVMTYMILCCVSIIVSISGMPSAIINASTPVYVRQNAEECCAKAQTLPACCKEESHECPDEKESYCHLPADCCGWDYLSSIQRSHCHSFIKACGRYDDNMRQLSFALPGLISSLLMVQLILALVGLILCCRAICCGAHMTHEGVVIQSANPSLPSHAGAYIGYSGGSHYPQPPPQSQAPYNVGQAPGYPLGTQPANQQQAVGSYPVAYPPSSNAPGYTYPQNQALSQQYAGNMPPSYEASMRGQPASPSAPPSNC